MTTEPTTDGGVIDASDAAAAAAATDTTHTTGPAGAGAFEADPADVAEQHADLVPTEDVLAGDSALGPDEITTENIEADAADVADQHRSVPYDEEDAR